jgi:hypothetical protein
MWLAFLYMKAGRKTAPSLLPHHPEILGCWIDVWTAWIICEVIKIDCVHRMHFGDRRLPHVHIARAFSLVAHISIFSPAPPPFTTMRATFARFSRRSSPVTAVRSATYSYLPTLPLATSSSSQIIPFPCPYCGRIFTHSQSLSLSPPHSTPP